MVNIIAQGFENVNKSGWTVSQAAYLRTLQHLRQHAGIKIALLKSKALLERVRGTAPPSPFRKKSILVIEINPQKI